MKNYRAKGKLVRPIFTEADLCTGEENKGGGTGGLELGRGAGRKKWKVTGQGGGSSLC